MSRKIILIKQELLRVVYELNRSGLLAENEKILPFFFFNDTATTEIYTLSLHDALPISAAPPGSPVHARARTDRWARGRARRSRGRGFPRVRSEEHTSELQSQSNLVCRLLLEKKKHLKQLNNLLLSNLSPSPTNSLRS